VILSRRQFIINFACFPTHCQVSSLGLHAAAAVHVITYTKLAFFNLSACRTLTLLVRQYDKESVNYYSRAILAVIYAEIFQGQIVQLATTSVVVVAVAAVTIVDGDQRNIG